MSNQAQNIKEDTRFYRWILRGYHQMLHFIFRHKVLFFCLSALFGLSSLWLLPKIPIANLPKIEKRESLLKIDWQTAISIEENLQRIKTVDQELAKTAVTREAEIGIQQFCSKLRIKPFNKPRYTMLAITSKTKKPWIEKFKNGLDAIIPPPGFGLKMPATPLPSCSMMPMPILKSN
ncbi:MAG: efflux RND transporter permease subunit [Haliscomenobacter sp.]|nr:efflux RND transporter permease subunit [Haliscomenobacter sp.]